MRPIDELMQLAVDGAATPEEERELREALERSPEARQQFAMLQSLARTLDNAPVAEAPDIKDAVMSQIRGMWGRASARPEHSIHRRRWLAFAYAAAAVIVIAIAVQRAVPPHESSATMAQIEEEWPVVARAASGPTKMTIRGSGGEFVVEVSPKGPHTLDWDRAKLTRIEPNRFRKVDGAAGATVITLRLPDQTELHATIDLP